MRIYSSPAAPAHAERARLHALDIGRCEAPQRLPRGRIQALGIVGAVCARVALAAQHLEVAHARRVQLKLRGAHVLAQQPDGLLIKTWS